MYRMSARDMDVPEPTVTGAMPEFMPMTSEWRRDPGHVQFVLREEDEDQAVRIDRADVERKGLNALRALLAFLAFLAIAGWVGEKDREMRQAEMEVRAER